MTDAIEKAIKFLEKEGYKVTLNKPKTFIIGNYEVTEPVKYKTYKEVQDNIPAGFKIPPQWQLFYIFENDLNGFIRKEENAGFYWSSTLYPHDVYHVGLYLGRNLSLYSDNENLADSNGYGRIVYIREFEMPILSVGGEK